MRYAPDGAFLITPNCFAIAAVWLNAALFITPIPLAADGQTSLLISFIIHVWWPFGSVGPSFRVNETHSAWWSRQ